jgi:hypothetical protein
MAEMAAAWFGGATLGLLALALVWLGRVNDAAGRLERKLDALLKHSGIDPVQLAMKEALDLVKAGKRIQAIKAYRDLTGASLPEAKAAVEKLQER